MNLEPKTLLQILILTVGIYVVLSFLRTTRGSGLVRGLGVALFVVVGGLWFFATQLGLPELKHIVEGVAGFIVVILAIVFQPELRRGIVSLGENPMLRGIITTGRREVVEEIAAASIAMAKKKQGALIAIERETPLDSFIDTGVRVDSEVSRLLIDSIFQHAGPLHDGAVIIRGDRIESATSILPLSETDELGKSTGTRHRAALGLSEETDAVVVAVSEETGLISVCRGGKMERRIPRAELENVLRARLGEEHEVDIETRGARALKSLRGAFTDNVAQKLLALLLATGLFWLSHRAVTDTETFTLTVVAASSENAPSNPTDGILRILLPGADAHLTRPLAGTELSVEVEAARSVLDQLRPGLGGVVKVPRAWIDAERILEVGDVLWGLDRVIPGLDVTFEGSGPLTLFIEQHAETILPASEDQLEFVALPPGRVVAPGSLEFDPDVIAIRGPQDAIAKLDLGEETLSFTPIDLSDETGRGFVRRLELAPRWSERLTLEGDLFVRGRLAALDLTLASIEAEVVLVSFDPTKQDLTDVFLPPTDKVEAIIRTRGLFPETADEGEKQRNRAEVLQLVKDHLRVYIDLARIDDGSSQGHVEVGDLDAIWRRELGHAFDGVRDDGDAALWIEIADEDRALLLTRRGTGEDGPVDEEQSND